MTYGVLSSGPGALATNESAVGFEYGPGKVELAGTGGGSYSGEILLNDGGANDHWIAFYARSESWAQLGNAHGSASIVFLTLTELSDLPPGPVPLPASILCAAPALALLAGRRRRA